MKIVEQRTKCPYCGDVFPLATAIRDDDDVPKSGDFSFCFTCGEVSIFDSTVAGGARKPNVVEQYEINTDADLPIVRREWRRQRR